MSGAVTPTWANLQSIDIEISSIAGLTSAGDTAPYYTGSGTAALMTVTAAGRAILDDATASDQRTTLGLGTIATQSAGNVAITGGNITGITDLVIADGGTGSSTMAGAQYNLGVGNPTAIGDMLAGMADGRWYRLAGGSTNQLLHATTSGTPTWSAVVEADITLADNTTLDASTTKHGFVPKLTAPGAGLLNVYGIGNGETAMTAKALFDTTNPAAMGTAAPGTQLIAARRDHVHPAEVTAPSAAGGVLYDTGSAWGRLAAGTAGQALLSQGAAAEAWGYAYECNPIGNGAFQIAQRGATIAAADYDVAAVTLDRWWTFSSTAGVNLTVSQVASGLAGTRYAAKTQRTNGETASGTGYFATALGSDASIPYQDQTICVSWKAKRGANFSPTSYNHRVSCQTGTGTDQACSALFVGAWTGSVETHGAQKALTTSFQEFTQTFSIPSGATEAAFYFNWATTGTAGADDSIYIADVRLNRGTVPAPYVWEYAEELRRCQRYLQVYGGTNTYQPLCSGFCRSNTVVAACLPLPVRMRASPTGSVSAAGDWGAVKVDASTVACTGFTVGGESCPDAAWLTLTGLSGLTIGYGTAVFAVNTTAARLILSAEL